MSSGEDNLGLSPVIGVPQRRVVQLFLWESILLGVFGAIAGATVSAMTAEALNSAQVHFPGSFQLFLLTDPLEFLPKALGGAIGLISVVTALAVLYPTLRAVRLKPTKTASKFR